MRLTINIKRAMRKYAPFKNESISDTTPKSLFAKGLYKVEQGLLIQ